jgi:hypothetical protein
MTRQFKDIPFKGFSVGTARISEFDFDLPYDATFQALDSVDGGLKIAAQQMDVMESMDHGSSFSMD